MAEIIYKPVVEGASLKMAMSGCCEAPVSLNAEAGSDIEYARCTSCEQYLKPAGSDGFRAGGV